MKIAFISGLAGTGKSTLYEYFLKNPISNWTVYDFDKGMFTPPEDFSKHDEWRTKETKHFFELAKKNTNTLILGRCMTPQQTLDIGNALGIKKEDIYFGLLTCEGKNRKSRLHKRGTPKQWRGHQPEYDVFHKDFRKFSSFESNTSNETLEETATKIVDWIKKI